MVAQRARSGGDGYVLPERTNWRLVGWTAGLGAIGIRSSAISVMAVGALALDALMVLRRVSLERHPRGHGLVGPVRLPPAANSRYGSMRHL